MLDYTLIKGGCKNFILNYYIFNGNIIVNYADKSVETVPYSIEKEKEILERMKLQVIDSKNKFKDLNYRYEIFLKLFIDIILLYGMFIFSIFNYDMSIITNIIGNILCSGFSLLFGYNFFKYRKIRNDVMKNLLFLRNEDSLNISIRDNPNVTMKLNEKIREKIYGDRDSNFKFSFNSIDNISYSELYSIYSVAYNKGNVRARKRHLK